MAQVQFYRYVGQAEADSIVQTGVIKSSSGITWFTPDFYESVQEAQEKLALPQIPTHRVGPVPADEMPDFDHCPIRPVRPRYGQPGGGVEAATTGEVKLFRIASLV